MRDQPSSTALLVARGVHWVATHPQHGSLVDEATASLASSFLKTSESGTTGRTSSILFQLLGAAAQRLTVPGIALHYVLRKLCVEALVNESLQQGYSQVVVIGGGLDTLAVRLAKRDPTRHFLEVDHPATQCLKKEVVARVVPGSAVEFLAADLSRQPLSRLLCESPAFDARKPTLFIAEAVFMYLPPEKVAQQFDDILGLGGPARIIFSFMEPRRDGSNNFQNATWIADLWLRIKGEPATFGLDPQLVETFLGEHGFMLDQLIRDDEYHRRYLPDGDTATLARGEHLAVASRF